MNENPQQDDLTLIQTGIARLDDVLRGGIHAHSNPRATAPADR